MKWLYRLDYKYGKYHIPHLMRIIVVGMAVVYTAGLVGIPLQAYMSLDISQVLQGQVWRLITFVFVPASSSGIWILITLYFYYFIGTAIENTWGGFRFNLYYLFGILGAIAAAFVSYFAGWGGYGSNQYLNLSLFLAFATLSPDTQFTLFFIIPIKAKWMAIGYLVLTGWSLISAFTTPGVGLILGLSSLISIAFSFLGYFLFFWSTMVEAIRNQIRMMRNRRDWKDTRRNWRDNNR